MTTRIIDVSTEGIRKSLNNLARNKRADINTPMLAALILERWEHGTLGDFPVPRQRVHTRKSEASNAQAYCEP